MNPEEYRQQINALGLGELKKMTIVNYYDAEKVLKRVLDLKNSLKQIKSEINLEIERTKEMSGNVTPYEKLTFNVDNLMTNLDRLKTQLENYMQKEIREEKPVKEVSQEITKEFCPHCGSVIDPSDKFCGNCGQRLCCLYCGSVISQSDKFCGNCGQRLWVG